MAAEVNINGGFSLQQRYDYGFPNLADESDVGYEARVRLKQAWMAKYTTAIEKQQLKWNKQLAKEHRFEKLPKLKELCRMGAPASRRPNVWFAVSGAHDLFLNEPNANYLRIAPQAIDCAGAFSQIEKDLDRTFPNHPYFKTEKGIDSLRNILVAFAVKKPEIGYCQSMNFIAGILILFFPKELDKAFWTLVAVIENILPADYYTPSMIGLHSDLMVLERLLEKKVPAVAAHFKANNVQLNVICISWFLCLFLNTLPIETTLRVWDTLMFEHSKVIFRVSLALFKLHQSEILAMGDDLGGLYTFLKDIGQSHFDCDALLETAFDIESLGKGDIQSLRDECRIAVQNQLQQVQANRDKINKR